MLALVTASQIGRAGCGLGQKLIDRFVQPVSGFTEVAPGHVLLGGRYHDVFLLSWLLPILSTGYRSCVYLISPNYFLPTGKIVATRGPQRNKFFFHQPEPLSFVDRNGSKPAITELIFP